MIRLPEGEIANTLTNGLTVLLGGVGAMLLMPAAWEVGDPWRIAGCAVFAATLMMVYVTSTLSHAVEHERPRQLLRLLDQAFIYLLIVGTYTPLGLTFLRSQPWLWFLYAVWGLAVTFAAMKLFWGEQPARYNVWSYLVLGWLLGVPMACLIGVVPSGLLLWVLAGGLCYTIGIIFHLIDDPRYHCHAIWHSLALAGSACHFFAIYYYVAEGPHLWTVPLLAN